MSALESSSYTIDNPPVVIVCVLLKLCAVKYAIVIPIPTTIIYIIL